MSTMATTVDGHAIHPVNVYVEPALERRNRLTTAFRLLLALPHIVLVGGPAVAVLSWTASHEHGPTYEWSGGGLLGGAAGVCALIAWFAIVFTGRHPYGLWNLAAFYLRWRVRAVSYTALLRDDYPPFGDAPYPARVELGSPPADRDRLTVGLRILLAIPHLFAIWALGVAWSITTVIAWFWILVTGRMPVELHRFGVGVLRWTTRVEAYLLLLHDEYPPFTLE